MMRIMLILALLWILCAALPAADSVGVPWEEFKMLYKESIENRLAEKKAPPPQRKPQTHTIDEAVYVLKVGKQIVEGEVMISGKIIAGDPAPIPLFANDLIIAGTKQIIGGSLISSTTDSQKILFLPDGSGKPFQIALTFLVNPREDSRSRLVSFAVPPAIRNSLQLTLPPEINPIETPGIADSRGIYHFSLNPCMSIRYREKAELAAAMPVEIDTFSRIQPQSRRLLVTTTFAPAHAIVQPITVQFQPEAQYLGSSLKPSWIAKKIAGCYQIQLPPDEQGVFSMQFAIDESKAGGYSLRLPAIKDNIGKEGDFIADEPDDGQLSLSGNGLVSHLPISRLSQGLRPSAEKRNVYLHIPAGEALKLEFKRFATVSAPPIVLDAQYFFTSFDENGSVLSVLVMDLPPEAGPRLSLKPAANARVWSLKVNDQTRKVYTNQGDTWIIPLDEGKPSRVELAMVSQGEKLGLQGRLETVLPQTGLAARSLCVGLALPERVQLLSLEGPVSPAPDESWKLPKEFIGKPYLFSRSFHNGEGLKLAVSYKEPVKQETLK